MKNRIASIVLCLCLVLALLPTSAFAAGEITVAVNGVTYTADSLEAAIASAISDSANTTVESLDTVTSLEITGGEVSAEDWEYIKNKNTNTADTFKLTLPALKALKVADTVTAVAPLPASFFMVYSSSSQESQLQEVDIAKLTDISSQAFTGCTALVSVRFPDVERITGFAPFSVCTSLTTASFLKAVAVGENMFINCYSLTTVSFPKAEAIGRNAFSSCSLLTDIDLPKAKTIDDVAFSGCSSLTDIDLPKAKTIGDYAFSGCSSLTTASFPEAEAIGDGAFSGCSSLTDIDLPKVETIGAEAFSGCFSLTGIGLPSVPPSIPHELHNNIFLSAPIPRYLTVLDANGAPVIGTDLASAIAAYKASAGGNTSDNTWYGWSLSQSQSPEIVTQPSDCSACVGQATKFFVAAAGAPRPTYQWYKNGVKLVGATDNCYTIASVAFADSGTYYCEASNASGSAPCLPFFFTATAVTSAPTFVTAEASMTDSADKEASFTLTAAPTVATTYRVYSSESDDDVLTDVTPTLNGAVLTLALTAAPTENVTYFISAQADGEIESGRTEVTLNKYTRKITVAVNGVTYTANSLEAAIASAISDSANTTVESLDTVTSLEITGGEVSAEDWEYIKNKNIDTADTFKITLPALKALKVADTVTAVAPLPDSFFKTLSNSSQESQLQEVDIAKLTDISGNAFSGCKALTTASFPEAETIGENTFYSCVKLTDMDFPKAETIRQYAFFDCFLLTTASFPEAKTISEAAFGDCTKLTDIDLPKAETIGSSAFLRCAALTDIDLPKAETIGSEAFAHCVALTDIDLPKAKTIGSSAFLRCAALTDIDLPKAETIGAEAFSRCAALTDIDLPKAETIGAEAFAYCAALTDIDLPKAETIGAEAFWDCAALTDIDLPKAETIGSLAFWDCSSLTDIDLPKAETIGSLTFAHCAALTDIGLPSVPPTVSADTFLDSPTPRYLTVLDANGAPVIGTPLTSAIAAYKASADGDTSDNTWYGCSLPQPPEIVTQPTDCSAGIGQAKEFSVEASGVPKLTYQWYKNGVKLVGATDKSYAIASVTLADAGTYYCEASNRNYSVACSPFVFTVTSAPRSSSFTGFTTPIFTASVLNTQDGSVSVSPTRAVENATLTITVTPNEGKLVDKVTVTDADGKAVAVTENENGKYSFKQPVGGAKVSVSFKDNDKAETDASTNGEASHNPFSDVKEGDWFYDAVSECYTLGMLKGTSDTSFSPYAPITRGMLVTVLYRIEGSPSVSGNSTFGDVQTDSYFEQAIAWAASNDIAGGIGNNKFAPNAPITREQLATVLYRYAQYSGRDVSVGESTDISAYSDAPSISKYAISAISWACGAGIINGDGGKLMPNGMATRAEAAAMLVRFLHKP